MRGSRNQKPEMRMRLMNIRLHALRMAMRACWLSSFLALTALPAQAQDSAAAQQQIREAIETWRKAFNSGDANGVCDLFAPELIADFQGQPERNYESLCASLRRSLRDNRRSFRYTSDIKEILVSGDLVVVRLTWTLEVTRNGRDRHKSQEPGMDIFRLQSDGRWRIIRYLAYPAKP
jgi:uncharacterized protein (TIGR02246 family)